MIPASEDFIADFVSRLKAIPRRPPRRVLELGTRRCEPGKPTTHKTTMPWDHIGVDVEPGEDVDVVADAHALPFPDGHFDAALAVAVWEHLRRPWLAAAELARVVSPGGVALVTSHQSFPLHSYPGDYFRFSTAAMAELFAPDHGWRVVRCEHRHPCKVVPLTNAVHASGLWNNEAPAWLIVECLAERV